MKTSSGFTERRAGEVVLRLGKFRKSDFPREFGIKQRRESGQVSWFCSPEMRVSQNRTSELFNESDWKKTNF